MTIDEEPVAEDVDQVCCDQRQGDGADVVEGLQVTAEGEVEEECRGAVVECAEEGDCAGEDGGVDGEAQHQRRSKQDDDDEYHSEACGEDEAMEKPAVGFVKFTCSMGLGEIGIEAEENTGYTEGHGVVEDLAECGGGDGECRVGHVSDHHGIDDAHEHPADFSENERQGKGKDGSDLLSDRHDLRGPPPSPPIMCQSIPTKRFRFVLEVKIPIARSCASVPCRRDNPGVEPGLHVFYLSSSIAV
jgi:hypothetical protein